MIKFDRDVHLALKNLEKNGFETYAIGDCVRDSMRGYTPYDWDLVTKATLEDMKRIFPKGEEIENGIRMDFTYEVPGDPEEEIPATIEGVVCDIMHFDGTVEDLLEKETFTVNAMADNPERQFIDPYNGRNDINDKLVRTIRKPDVEFKEKPICMIEAVRLTAELDFDLHKSVYDGILSNWTLLRDYNRDEIRDELIRILTSNFAGKGLNIMAGTGLMAIIVGEEVSRKMSASEMKSFTVLCENIDKTKPVKDRRLGLLYTCFTKKRGLAAIELMNYDGVTKQHLNDAMVEIINIQFLGKPVDFKKYVYEHGLERYNYLNNLTKAQRIVYGHPSTKIESRNHMMKEIVTNREPLFPEDLVIDANDLLEAGIAKSPEDAERLLDLTMADVHSNPKNNVRKYLLKRAKKYSRSKYAAKTRYVKWLR